MRRRAEQARPLALKPRTLPALSAAIALAFNAAALAEEMSRAEHHAARAIIESDFKGVRIGCEPMRANVKAICLADADGRERVALAELQALYQPSDKARYEVRLAQADAIHAVARQTCDDRAGPAKNDCVKQADAAHVAARADAKAERAPAQPRSGKIS